MNRARFCLVAYDIADDARRSHVVKILLDYGQRVQESVFWLQVDDELQNRLMKRLNSVMDNKADILWVVPVCWTCKRSVLTLGDTRMPETPEFYIV